MGTEAGHSVVEVVKVTHLLHVGCLGVVSGMMLVSECGKMSMDRPFQHRLKTPAKMRKIKKKAKGKGKGKNYKTRSKIEGNKRTQIKG